MANIKNHIRVLLIIILIVFIFINIPIVCYGYEQEEDTDYVWLKEEITNVSTNKTDEPKLNSKCAVVFDRNSKTVIFSKNANKRVPMASTTKIMTAIVMLENLDLNNDFSLNTQVEVCKEAGAIGGSRLGLKKGDKISYKDLLYGLMLCSRK